MLDKRKLRRWKRKHGKAKRLRDLFNKWRYAPMIITVSKKELEAEK